MKPGKSLDKRQISLGHLASSDKLEQIRTGKKLKRQTTAKQIQNVVYDSRDGSKIKTRITQEKFEESEVVRKKRNYVMYQSKLGTEKNTEKTKIAAPKPKSKPKTRVPSPRKEEIIKIQKKRKDYLDNYQYKETKVIKKDNPKKRCLVEHQRLGDIIGGYYETTTYQKRTINHGLPRINDRSSKDNMSKTFYNSNFRGNRQEKTPSKRNPSTGSLNNPNEKNENKYSTKNLKKDAPNTITTTNINTRKYNRIIPPRNREQIKSEIITRQIYSKRPVPTPKPTPKPNPKKNLEYQVNTYNPRYRKIRDQSQKSEKNLNSNSIKKITRTVTEKTDNLGDKNSKGVVEQTTKITSITISKDTEEKVVDEPKRSKTPRKVVETRIEKKEERIGNKTPKKTIEITIERNEDNNENKETKQSTGTFGRSIRTRYKKRK